MKIRVGLRTSLAQSFLDDISKGTAGSPKIEIYEGAMPANIGDAITGALLAEFPLVNTVGTVSAGVLTFDAIASDSSANNSGTAGFARVLDRDADEILYLTTSITGGGGDLQLSTVILTAGEPVTITSGVIRAGL